MRGGKGATIGGVIGGVVGLIFPPSILASAAVGAAVGGLSAKLHDAGFPDDNLRQIGERLKPNTSGLIVVLEHAWANRVEDELRSLGANIANAQVRADVLAQLEAEPAIVVVETDHETTAASSSSASSAGDSASSEIPPPEASTQSGAGPSPA